MTADGEALQDALFDFGEGVFAVARGGDVGFGPDAPAFGVWFHLRELAHGLVLVHLADAHPRPGVGEGFLGDIVGDDVALPVKVFGSRPAGNEALGAIDFLDGEREADIHVCAFSATLKLPFIVKLCCVFRVVFVRLACRIQRSSVE